MPVYTNLDVDYSSRSIGTCIRTQRKRVGWTLERLANKLSVSIGMLSAVENGKASIAVDLFLAVAEALQVPLDALLPASTTKKYLVSRRSSVTSTSPWPVKLVHPTRETFVSYHNSLWPLAQSFLGKHIEPFAIEIARVSDEEIRYISHHNEEFVFLLSGAAECLLQTPEGGKSERLHVGDCMYFWSYLPHCIRSVAADPTFAVHVIHAPNETSDSEFTNEHTQRGVYLIDASKKNALQQIANRITALRQTSGLSIGEFARFIGVSVRRLKQVETGQKPVALDLLFKMCRTFRKPREYFLPSNFVQRPFSSVTRRARIRRGPSAAHEAVGPFVVSYPGASFKELARNFPSRGMEPWLMTFKSNSDVASARSAAHQGQEFVYVLAGALQLVIGENETEEVLFPGDSCFIDSSLPHRFMRARIHSFEKRPTIALGVFWLPSESGHLGTVKAVASPSKMRPTIGGSDGNTELRGRTSSDRTRKGATALRAKRMSSSTPERRNARRRRAS
jgi:transcriptional regulator with XRE-family HTH domain/uncharacterized cupin superfamily protein